VVALAGCASADEIAFDTATATGAPAEVVAGPAQEGGLLPPVPTKAAST
jgi:hypothetical protein